MQTRKTSTYSPEPKCDIGDDKVLPFSNGSLYILNSICATSNAGTRHFQLKESSNGFGKLRSIGGRNVGRKAKR